PRELHGRGPCRLCRHPRLGGHRAPFGGRGPGGMGLGGGHRRDRGALVFLLEPPATSGVANNMKSPSSLIDEKIKKLGDWRGTMLAKVRAIIRDADPEIVEE